MYRKDGLLRYNISLDKQLRYFNINLYLLHRILLRGLGGLLKPRTMPVVNITGHALSRPVDFLTSEYLTVAHCLTSTS